MLLQRVQGRPPSLGKHDGVGQVLLSVHHPQVVEEVQEEEPVLADQVGAERHEDAGVEQVPVPLLERAVDEHVPEAQASERVADVDSLGGLEKIWD